MFFSLNVCPRLNLGFFTEIWVFSLVGICCQWDFATLFVRVIMFTYLLNILHCRYLLKRTHANKVVQTRFQLALIFRYSRQVLFTHHHAQGATWIQSDWSVFVRKYTKWMLLWMKGICPVYFLCTLIFPSSIAAFK